MLDKLSGAVEQTAEYLYQRGATVAALGGNPTEVVALFERAVEADGRHAGALFGLALENDRRGNDETALDLYQRAAATFPDARRHAAEPGHAVRRSRSSSTGPSCATSASSMSYPDHPRARLLLQGRRRPRATCSTTKRPSAGSDRLAAGAQHPGHRFRAVGPQPQLPAEDGHSDARRPDPHAPSRNCWRARTSARRRSSKSATCCTRKGLELGQFAAEKARARTGRRSGDACRPTSRPCSNGRSPI